MNRAEPKLKNSFKYLLSLLASVLNEKDPPKPNDNTDWASVFYLAELHSVSGMTSYAVDKLSDADKPCAEVLEKFRNAGRSELILESNIELEKEKLTEKFIESGISLLYLKGILIKNYYPLPCMRTMSDVDVLYNVQQKDLLRSIMVAFGYSVRKKMNHELDFVKAPFYHYEFHSVLASDAPDDSCLHSVWDNASYEGNSRVGSLSLSDSYIYLLYHLATHLRAGGAGLRMIMDIYVFLRYEKDNLDFYYINKELTKLNLLDFSKKITDIANNWFSTDNPDTDNLVADYVMSSCTFGTSETAVVNSTLKAEKRTGKKTKGFGRIMRKIFPKYSYLCSFFPSASKCKLLYPIYVVGYWFHRAFIARNINTSNIGSYMKNTDSEEALRLIAVMDELKLPF